MPPSTEELKSKDLNSDSINIQATQNLNNFLNSLGFKINTATLESNNTPQKEQGPLELIARAKDGVYLVNEQDKGYLEDKSRIIYDNSTVAQFNSSGTLLAVSFTLTIECSYWIIVCKSKCTWSLCISAEEGLII